jgi:homocysteine S-methyltransferase
MSHHQLPHLTGDGPVVTDGGLETSLIFRDGLDLPHFAAFPLIRDEAGREILRTYFNRYLDIARRHNLPFVLDTATWRANPDWGERLDYTNDELARVNRDAVAFAEDIRAAAGNAAPVVLNGVVGPRGDGYVVGQTMSAEEAKRYHMLQIQTFADAGADMVTAVTMTYPEEATGIVRAAEAADIPVAISFTVETDGRLPNGQDLGAAIEQVDAESGGAAEYHMINCAHPTHFQSVIEQGGDWIGRLGGIRANASKKSHAELDEAEELDSGNPSELAREYSELRSAMPNVRLLGGCCGTDHTHVGEICSLWLGD